MIQTPEDKMIKLNITESLNMLVDDLQKACKQLNYPVLSEVEARALIASVNQQSIAEGKMIESIHV